MALFLLKRHKMRSLFLYIAIGLFLSPLSADPGDLQKEAQDHFDRAQEAFVDWIGYTTGAAAAIEMPPAVIITGYMAVTSLIKSATEYNAGVECEKRARESEETKRDE